MADVIFQEGSDGVNFDSSDDGGEFEGFDLEDIQLVSGIFR